MKKIIVLILLSLVFTSIFGCTNGEEKSVNTEKKELKDSEDKQYLNNAEEKALESRFKPSENKKIEF